MAIILKYNIITLSRVNKPLLPIFKYTEPNSKLIKRGTNILTLMKSYKNIRNKYDLIVYDVYNICIYYVGSRDIDQNIL